MTDASRSEPAPGPVAGAPQPWTLIDRMAAQFAGPLDNGERARLRRYDPGKRQLKTLALATRLLIEAGVDDSETSPTRLRRWALLLHFLSLLAGTRERAAPHQPRAFLGKALFAAGVSEARVLVLLEARGIAFDVLLDRVVRRLAASGTTELDAWRLWELMRDPDGHASPDERLAVARDFFREKAKEKKQAN